MDCFYIYKTLLLTSNSKLMFTDRHCTVWCEIYSWSRVSGLFGQNKQLLLRRFCWSSAASAYLCLFCQASGFWVGQTFLFLADIQSIWLPSQFRHSSPGSCQAPARPRCPEQTLLGQCRRLHLESRRIRRKEKLTPTLQGLWSNSRA